MTYLEQMKAATNDFERSKVVERYTNEFAALMSAAGLNPTVGTVPTAEGQVWISYTNVPAKDLIDIIAAIATADVELGDRAAEIHGDILACANLSVALESMSEPRTPPTAEEVAAVLDPDPDAETIAWLCPEAMSHDDLELMASARTPLEKLHKGKLAFVCSLTLTDDEGGPHDTAPFVPIIVHRSEEDEIVAFTGYSALPLAEFRKTRADKLEPATVEEVLEREYNPKWGYFHHARVKYSRKVYVLTQYVTYGDAAYLEENHPAWQEPEESDVAGSKEIEPSPSTIELDEKPEILMPSREEQWDAVDENIGEFVRLAGGRDDLERLCRQLFAVKQEKKEADAEYNEQIKAIESDIQGIIRARDKDRYQHRLPLEAVPDAEAEKAIEAASEESQQEATEGPLPGPGDGPPIPLDNSEPEEEPPARELAEAESPETEELTPPVGDFPQCEACLGHGSAPGEGPCELCGGEGIPPEIRESDEDGMLLCARCGSLRSFWAFLKYDGGRKGHVCNVCRKV